MKISPAFLFAIAPGADPKIVDAIVANQSLIGIVDATELAWFFGQSACETQGFTRLEENLFYTSAKRLTEVWPAHFPSEAAASGFVRQPQKLANLVYGGRYGNTMPNDGFAYRGSGLGQTTFHDNYAEVERVTGVQCVDHPDLLRQFPSAVEAFAVYWAKRDLGRFVRANDMTGLTKAIQGGSSGLADRRRFTDRALAWIASAGVAKPVTVTATGAGAPSTGWLRRGMVGARVEALQRSLQRAGFYVGGAIDGKFGDGTELAVSEFQKARGLVVDGVVGEKTVKALETAQIPPVAPVPTVPGVSAPGGLAGLLAALLSVILSLFKPKGK